MKKEQDLEVVKEHNQENMSDLFRMRQKHLDDDFKKSKYSPYIHIKDHCVACTQDEKFTTECFVVTLKCGDVLHEDCAMEWRNSLKEEDHKFSCPTCRKVGTFFD